MIIQKELTGYILGIDEKFMYSIIVDETEQKSYQLNCEYELLNLDKNDIKVERKFKMFIDETDEVHFEFLDEYINTDVIIDDLNKDNEE